MAAAAPSMDIAMAQWRELFADATFGREVQLWVERADPLQRQQFERTFAKLNSEFQHMAKTMATTGSGGARSAAGAEAGQGPASPHATATSGGTAASKGAGAAPKASGTLLVQPPSPKQLPPPLTNSCLLPPLGSPKSGLGSPKLESLGGGAAGEPALGGRCGAQRSWV